ncbi:uncharacterized protein LOC141619306 [Silene latifolia]|uniref:uncharacterized protein LOC141619306 n=1 Tax=Silene latifolia TaxID=37657 RepID=UPI003D7863BB
MESLNQTPRFCYHFGNSEGDSEYAGMLDIFAHNARNIHNICIYDNQDVYAKFSLTYNPDDMVSTRVIVGGGKNPEFDEKLMLNVAQIDAAVLKCEVWMQSRARNLMEDQLLGFALVPLSQIIKQGGKIICQDFSLSSTDLFHSPAGTVKLSLTLTSTKYPFVSSLPSPNLSGRNSSIASEVVLLDRNDYSRVEFPDVSANTEDQMIISGYFNSNNNHSFGSFLHLGSVLDVEEDDDDDMNGISLVVNEISPSNQNSGVFSSTMASVSEEQNTVHLSLIERSISEAETEDKQSNADDDKKDGSRNVSENEAGNNTGTGYSNLSRVISGRVNMDIEDEQSAMQQQIVDMYMKSMQQFTESLAKMKLPIDLNPNPDGVDNGNMIQIMERSGNLEAENKKDGSRVFYGSRAFF